MEMLNVTIKDVYDFFNKYPDYIGYLKVKTRFGYKKILACDITAYNSDVFYIKTQSGKELKCSPDHLLLSTNCKFIKVKDLNKYDYLYSTDNIEIIKEINKLDYTDDLYDIEVDEVKEYFTNDIVSHNSSITDALTYCLFGKPYRDIKINSLINRVNRKNLYTECVFSIDNDEYKIIRSLKPDSLKVIKNDQDLDMLSSKLLVQDQINKIVGIDYKLFKNIISLSISYNKPFLLLSAQEKRDIIESIFNLKVFGQMSKNLKNRISKLNTEIEINKQTIEVMKESIKNQQSQIKQLKENRDNFEINKKKDIEQLNNQISDKIKQKDELDTQLKELEKSFDKTLLLDKTNLIADLNKEKVKLIIDKSKISDNIKNKQKLEKNIESIIADELIKSTNLEKMESLNITLQEELNELPNDKSIDEINDVVNPKIDYLKKKINNNEFNIKRYNEELKFLGNDTCPTCKREMTKEYKDDKIKELNKLILDCDNIKNNEELTGLLGYKKFLEDKNIKINNLTQKLNINTNSVIMAKKELESIQNRKNDYQTELSAIKVLDDKEIDVKLCEIDKNIDVESIILKNMSNISSNCKNVLERIKYVENDIVTINKNMETLISRSFDINIEEIENIYNKDCDKFKQIYGIHKSNIETNQQYSIVSDIISDSGVKTYFYKKLIPILNEKINSYLQKFELSIRLTFDELMKESIISFDSYGEAVDYNNFSGGEKTKTSLAILLSFIDISKIISNFSSNILIVDELLDDALDNDGVELVLHHIKNIITIV